jgi:hypothetical protein
MLEELGDQFEVLSDEEVKEAGFTLADDEAIVVAKPPAPPPSGGGDNGDAQKLRDQLHQVNQESANRRVQLREAQSKIQALEGDLGTLRQNYQTLQVEQAKAKATKLFLDYAAEKKYTFVSETAGEDARNEVFGAIDWQQPVTRETLVPLVDSLIQKKPYVLRQGELGPTDGGKQGGGPEGAVAIDLEEVARSFNIPYKPEGAQQ